MPELNCVILETDTIQEVADKIFNNFMVLQSCTLKGLQVYDGEVIDKGNAVITEMKRIDRNRNWQRVGDGTDRQRRKRRALKNTIGGPIANKMFQFKHDTRNGYPVTTIWRIQ